MKNSGMKRRIATVISVGLMALMIMTLFAPAASAATTPQWNYSYPLGVARAQSVVVQTDNGVVYLVGGVIVIGDYSGTETATTRAYNPATGTWSVLASMGFATRGACGEVGADGRIYVMEGTSTGTQIYNITTNVWAAGATAPTDQWEAKSAVYGNSIYMFGGSHNDENETQIYDTVADTWSYGEDMPYQVYAGAVVYDGNYAYYFGGQNVSGMATTNVSRYSFATDSWSMLAPLPGAVAGEAAVIGPDGLIYVFGGADEALNTGMGAVYADTYTYDRESNTWATVDDMNVPRAWLGAAVYDNKVLSVGGNNPTTMFTTVESLDTLPNQLANLQKQVTLLQNQLAQANNNISDLTGDVSDLNAKNVLLKQQLVNLSAQLNQTTDDLNAALGTTNNNVNNAKSAADSANLIGMIGMILAIVAIVVAVVSMVMKKKTPPPMQMQPMPPQ